ncbi:MAG: hypothetical protein BWY64_03541 [bacterium ADurb.Bin363]|nr:MAG: hypothetical protein BWY64_03541 [bacterium ADurb.Bin363]
MIIQKRHNRYPLFPLNMFFCNIHYIFCRSVERSYIPVLIKYKDTISHISYYCIKFICFFLQYFYILFFIFMENNIIYCKSCSACYKFQGFYFISRKGMISAQGTNIYNTNLLIFNYKRQTYNRFNFFLIRGRFNKTTVFSYIIYYTDLTLFKGPSCYTCAGFYF